MSTQGIDSQGWQLAEVLANKRALFVLWAVKTLFCTTISDFLSHYKITREELKPLLDRLTVQGFLQQDGENYVLTDLGDTAVNYLGQLSISQFAHPERLSSEVDARFESVEELPALENARGLDEAHYRAGIGGAPAGATVGNVQRGSIESISHYLDDFLIDKPGTPLSTPVSVVENLFWDGREQDRNSPEATLVELPLIKELVRLRWQYQPGDIGAPERTGRQSFREVLLEQHLRAVLPEINRDEDTGEIWLDEPRVEQAISHLKRIFSDHPASLMRANEAATKLLQTGTLVQGTQELHQGKNHSVRYIDFAHPENNRFLVINQFRVDLSGAHYIVPDIVLFVNGIPLVVIECKSPALTNPVEEGITQLFRYSGQQTASQFQADTESAPELFYFNQLLISTCFFQARFGAIGASYEHFQEWKDPYPVKADVLAREMGVETARSQQVLACGMLYQDNLLDLLNNFTVFRKSAGRMVKLIARYHQFRAVQKAIMRLQRNQTRRQQGENDERGGIIWHTQGSGKSLTMVFLIRKMRTVHELSDFKIVFVTDRKELQKQLKETAMLTEETPRVVGRIRDLEPKLLPGGPNLLFAMIQKYRGGRNVGYSVTEDNEDAYDASADDEQDDADDEPDAGIQEINAAENILVIIDEAHRSQARKLHANLRKALPNCARIAFTGTPILKGKQTKTHEIFGTFIDEYTIQESERDGATLPILYEGREAYIEIIQREQLDSEHEQIVRPLSREIRESLRENFETYREILEAPELIRRKAEDMLLHYAANILPNGFKAMVVSVSRLAAIRYRDALESARNTLVERLQQLPPEQRDQSEEQLKHLSEDDELKKLIRAYPLRDILRRLQFAAVVSPSPNDRSDTRVDWSKWTNEEQNEENVDNFKKPLSSSDADGSSPLAFVCVRSMLITGFDAPVVQALYLDRSIKDHELLQAIARVNRTSPDKTSGLVVDYFGIARNLKAALIAYNDKDVQGALVSIKDEYPLLADRHRRVLAIFAASSRTIQDVEGCVNLLRDGKIRADFEVKFKKFMASMDIVLPRPEALPFTDDAKQLGLINRSAAAVYRDEQLNLINVGNKVRKLIDEHIDALHIRQLIEPISILDEHFEQKLRRHRSDEANAAEMEHFARAYITQRYEQEDPAYYHKLSERLEAIVQALHENWSQRVEDLQAFINLMTKPRRIDSTGLDPLRERPFLGILEEEVRKGSRRFNIDPDSKGRDLSEAELHELASLTRRIVEEIRKEIADNDDFWLSTEYQEGLRKVIGSMLEKEGKRLIAPTQRRAAVASRLVQLAHALTPRLRDNG